ncbi:hypothetical protein D3C77_782080 [compost metagenome]
MVERQPAAMGGDRGAQMRGGGVAVFLGGGSKGGQVGGGGSLHGRVRRGQADIFPKNKPRDRRGVCVGLKRAD